MGSLLCSSDPYLFSMDPLSCFKGLLSIFKGPLFKGPLSSGPFLGPSFFQALWAPSLFLGPPFTKEPFLFSRVHSLSFHRPTLLFVAPCLFSRTLYLASRVFFYFQGPSIFLRDLSLYGFFFYFKGSSLAFLRSFLRPFFKHSFKLLFQAPLSSAFSSFFWATFSLLVGPLFTRVPFLVCPFRYVNDYVGICSFSCAAGRSFRQVHGSLKYCSLVYQRHK